MFAKLVFPPLSHILNWKDLFTGLNKIGVIAVVYRVVTHDSLTCWRSVTTMAVSVGAPRGYSRRNRCRPAVIRCAATPV